jgi:hypothetical protein
MLDKMQFLMMLQILLQQEPRMQFHSFYLESGVYNHNIKKCHRCIAIWCLEHPNEFIL